MELYVELTEDDLKRLVLKELQTICDFPLTAEDVSIQVKSKQNYKAEWEAAAFRATINKTNL